MKILISILFSLATMTSFAAELKIHAINVGWGQSVLIEGVNGKTILFDTGLSSKRQVVIDYLHENNIQQLDYFMLSHNHSDHGGAAQYIVREFKPKLSYYSGSEENTQRVFMQNWFSSYQAVGVPAPIGVPLGHVIDLGDGATATTIAVNGKVVNKDAVITELQKSDPTYQYPVASHINDYSIVLLIKYKGFDYLVSGDLGGHAHNGQKDFETPVIMSALISGNGNIKTPNGGIDILHIGHHGSKTSTNKQYLDLAKPEIAIVSVGPNQSHGLPNSEAIDDILIKNGIKVLQTDEGRLSDARTSTSGYVVGHIKITTDGNTYVITSDESSIDTSKASQQNVTGEGSIAGLPLTLSVDNSAGEIPDEDLVPVIDLSLDVLDEIMLNAKLSDDKNLTGADILIDNKIVKSFVYTDQVNANITYQIDKSQYTVGTHIISITARDSGNHLVSSKQLSFEINSVENPNDRLFTETEDNNNIVLANPVAANVTQINGYFPYTNDDEDWYQISLKAGDTLSLAMTGPTDYEQDYDLYLYSEGGTLLKYSEKTGSSELLSFYNPNVTKTKILYLLVSRYDGYSRHTPYKIMLSRN